MSSLRSQIGTVDETSRNHETLWTTSRWKVHFASNHKAPFSLFLLDHLPLL
jgi:hypothetical protein